MRTFTVSTLLLCTLLCIATTMSAQVPFRMNVGDGGPYIYGNVTFISDTGFDTKSVKTATSDDIQNTTFDEIYQSQRFVNGWAGNTESDWQACGFTPNETYTIHLHFTEIFRTGDDERVFDIEVEGSTILDDMDVHSIAGHDKYTVFSRNFTVSGDGCVDLKLVNGPKDFAILSAIEIVPIGTPEFHVIAFPVELVSFEAEAIDGKVALSWATASEINSDYFQVERSLNGEDFSRVSQQAAQGNSQDMVTYYAEDIPPHTGTIFYRLKQVDLDGAFTYSSVLEVSVDGQIEVSILGNPVNEGIIQFRIANNVNDYTAIVTDLQGRVIAKRHFEGNTPVGTLNIGQSAKGLYHLVIENFDFREHAKLMIH